MILSTTCLPSNWRKNIIICPLFWLRASLSRFQELLFVTGSFSIVTGLFHTFFGILLKECKSLSHFVYFNILSLTLSYFVKFSLTQSYLVLLCPTLFYFVLLVSSHLWIFKILLDKDFENLTINLKLPQWRNCYGFPLRV